MRHVKINSLNVYWKQIIGIVLASLFIVLIISYSVNLDTDVRPEREFEGGKLYKVGNIRILQLSGSYKEMGRQYGGLLKDEIREFYTIVIDEYYIKDKGLKYDDLKGISEAAYTRYPEKFKALMSGINETSGLPLEKVVILDQILGIQFLIAQQGECSAVAAWGEYTSGKPLVFGRNFDFAVDFKEYSRFLNVVVYNPVDDIPTAVVCYPGEITSFTGMNANGVFFEINEGAKSGGNIINEDRLMLPIELVRFLTDYSDVNEFDAAMNTTRSNYAFIVQVTDKNAAYSYEASIFDIKRRSGQEPGLLVATNDFVNPLWGLTPPIAAEDKSVQRRDNLIRLAHAYKGNITPETMMQIMDITFEDGGATWANRTAYQVVVEPANKTMWMKTRGIQDWIKIDLNKYFLRQGSHS
jgi:hypothetical protein